MRKSKYLLFITLVSITSFLFLSGLRAQAPLVEDLGYKGGSIPGIKQTDKGLNFILMGDWGRNGENYQKEVAAGMGKAAHDMHAEFVVATGDNFYPYGVQSTQDYHWVSSFEQIYTAQSLHVKWYPVLGNHDYASNPDAQIAYSKLSSRWTMPARYYSKKFNLPAGGTALFVFIDTDPYEKRMRGNKPDEKYPLSATDDQTAWLKTQLADTTPAWKIVVGHHPLYTGGWRKDEDDTKKMRAFLEPLFKQYKVDMYLCGHEHHLEYTKPEGNTHYILSGAASEARPATINPIGGKFTAATQGFAAISLGKKEALLQFINYKDSIIYSTTIAK